MKNISIILVLFILQFSVSAQDSALFTVWHADSASVVGVAVERFQTLTYGETIESSGLLILAHRTGKFFEFKEAATISVSELNREILGSLGMVECGNDWPNFKLWLAKGMSRNPIGPVYAGMPDLEWIVPADRIVANPKQTIALLWKPLHTDLVEYEFRVNSVFDEPIVNPMKLDTDRLILPLDTFTVEKDFPFVLIAVQSVEDRHFRWEEIGVRFSETSYFMPDSFEASSAIKAFEIGFYLEEHRACEYALPYYEKAVALSSHPFYREVLTNYKLRCSISK